MREYRIHPRLKQISIPNKSGGIYSGSWDSLPTTWFYHVVGETTKGGYAHVGDTVAWIDDMGQVRYAVITGVAKNGIISVGDESFGRFADVKISCPGGRGHEQGKKKFK